MKIQLQEIPIKDIFDKYVDSAEEGVTGYHGKLNIRPKYQREYIYDGERKFNVIRSIRHEYPLSIFYWSKKNDTYEMLDGQQRTLSICKYIAGEYSVDGMYFHNLSHDEQERILNYKLLVYVCEGPESEKLEWFKTINIAGLPLTAQEMRNAIYASPWTADAKRYFSKTGGPAAQVGDGYITGTANRQEIFEKVLSWQADRDNTTIEDIMAKADKDELQDASELWQYFQSIISWVKITFPVKRKEMKSVPWGLLYNRYHQNTYNASKLEKEIDRLMADDDVTKKTGIYEYLLDGEEKHLNIRAFTASQKRTMYTRQKGICPICKKHYEITEMEADHITPWSQGGHTDLSNGQMLCKECNRRKSDR